jgi:predicted alpha/beta superfamily hydrolase
MNRNIIFRGLLGLAVSMAVLLLTPPPAHGQAAQAFDVPARVTIKSGVLGEERVILVRTPPGYERGNERYPVLYMTDGDEQIAHTISTVAFLARNDRIPEMIIVGITNTDRTRDLTPTNASMPLPDGKAQPFPTSGGADKFLKFIETELIPNIESKYRVQPYRIFAGHSFGGLFAIHMMLSRPDLFNAYIAVSPSLFWDNEYELKRAEEFFKSHREWKKTLYLSLGNEPGNIQTSFNRFNEILKQYQPKGFDWLSQQMMEEDHGSVVLRSHYAGLRKIFEGWQLPVDPATGNVVGGWRSIEEHYNKLTQKFGYELRTPEALVNQIGYQLMEAGNMDEAIAAFKANVERYPNSPNVYDSLGEAYENTGRTELARVNYEKAYTLGKEQNNPNTNVFKANFDRVSSAQAKPEAGTKK